MVTFKCWLDLINFDMLFITFFISLKCVLGDIDDLHSYTTQSSDITTESDGMSAGTTMASLERKHVIECTSATDKLFKFAIGAYHNNSDYWIAHMYLQHSKSHKATDRHPFEVHLEHRTTACTIDEMSDSTHPRNFVDETPPTVTPKADGYRYFPGFGFYKRHQKLMEWASARQVCKSEGADLVVINSEEEAKILLQLSASLLYLKPMDEWNAEAYVGIYDFHHEGHFSTVTGQPLEESGYVHWSENEPNNFKEEDCVTMRRNSEYNDVKCSKLFEFICEIPDQ